MHLKKITKFLFIALILLIFTTAVFCYDNFIIHPKLSRGAIEIYNNQTNNKLTKQQQEWIIYGSIAEDADPRYLNHYYDPITGKGLNGYDELYGVKIKVNGVSTKQWAQEQNSVSGDYSEKAIIQNYKNNNFERAYQGIGHIIHLIQDMSVPAHTRNDSHAMGDPYEKWAEQNGNVDLSKAGFIQVNNLNNAFDNLASYSNGNFFSRDTINNSVVVNYKTEQNITYAYYSGHKIYKIKKHKNEIEYIIDDPLVHSDYWFFLHPKAIGYSAGVIDYFTKQFEKIDQENKEKQKLSFWSKLKNSISKIANNIKYSFGDIEIAGQVMAVITLDTAHNLYDIIKQAGYEGYVAMIHNNSNNRSITLHTTHNSQRITHNSQPETQNTQLTTQNTQQQNTEIQKHENTKTQKQEEEQEEAKTEETDRGSTSKIPEVEPLSVSVSRIIDGDTIELSTGEKVRYIGIDTPELNKQGPDDDECLAWEARIRNMELLSKGKVYLVKDPGVDKDKYGRLLRYVYAVETKSPKDVKAGSPALTSFGDLVSTTFINAQLVQEGFAKTFFCKPGWTDCPLMVDDQRKQIIMSAERLAEDNGYGIFGVCEDQMSEVRNRISDIGNQKTKDNNKITDDRQQTTNNNLQTDKEIKKEKETDNQKSRIDNPKKPFPFWLFTGNGDTTAPIITITSSPPAISSSTTANFQFSSDEKNVIFLLRQGYRGQVGEGDDSWQECSANIEINNLNNNQHSLEIKAIDQSGNKSVAITHSWLVDTIAPTSTINSLEQEYATSSFSVSWTGEDVIASSTASSTEISGLANYDLEYKIATGTEEWINWISATTSTSAAFNITVENNQNIYFKIRARDNAGNVGEWSNEAETKIDDNIASHVVISEFAVQGLSDSYDEFVELYNPTNFEVDITGWKLQYKSADGTNWSNKTGNNGLPSLFIKPRGFLLLAGKDYSLNASPDYWHNANWWLANNAGHIRIVDIVDKEDIEIDKIGYGNAIDPEDLPFMENIISGKSAERKANKNSTSETIASSTDKWTGNGFDSNNNSVDFIVRNTSDPQNSDSPTEPRSESPIFPETIQDLTVLHLFTSTSSMKLSWDSSNNSNINTGAFYDIRYNESVEDECELINNWHLANKVEESLPVPLEEEGIEQEVLINNLSPGKEYCFGIRVFNGSFWSFPSNIVKATTKTSQTQLTKIITDGNPKNIIITQTLTPDKSPYYIDYNLFIPSGNVLTIEPGVVIKFGSGRQGQWSWERVILFVSGSIKANGTEQNPIVFTSIYDDDYGGDSNGDGPTPVPDSAIWNSFQINSGGNVFNHNIFRYGGFDNRGIITFYNASTLYHENNLISNSIFDNNINGVGFRAYASDKQDIIQNNIFRNFQNSAISFLATDKSNPIITHNNFLNNKTAFLVERSHLGSPIINYNNIYGNNYGVKNINIDSCFAINAKHNWWGSETGPNNILNPDGQGDQIYGDVDYSEWVITEL